MAGLQLSGLASNFDWKSLVDQLVSLERAPITRIQAEQRANLDRDGALSVLKARTTALTDAVAALRDPSAFGSRVVSSSVATGAWSAAATTGAAVGSYPIVVTQLASASRLVGAADIGGALSSSSSVAGVTLATLRGATPVTAGTFSVNGHQISVSTADSLQDVFDALSTASGGDLVAAYDPATDRVSLSSLSAAPISLGAANDTSNLLRVLKLSSDGGASISSAASIASLSTTSTLATAGLAGSINGVDGSGNGSFQINGVSIHYNLNTDTLAGVLRSINASGAGVTATYDKASDRVVLANNRPGNLGISVRESGVGLLAALGLVSGATLEPGHDAVFSVGGEAARHAAANTLSEADHGIAGLSVTVSSVGPQTLTVANDTASVRRKIDALVAAYNSVQSYVDEQTAVTNANGKVTAGVLSSNREVQAWARELRRAFFAPTTGVPGSISSLDDLGLGFSGIGTDLKVLDEAKLSSALSEHGSDVEHFFQNSAGGLAARVSTLLERVASAGDAARQRLTDSNRDLDRQIAELERRVAQQKQVLTASFVAMESAQAKIQQQGTAITNAFFPANK